MALSPGSGPYATQALGSPAASITFSSIPGGYSTLRVLAIGTSNTAAENTRWKVQVNGDSASHYDHQNLYGVNATAAATVVAADAQWVPSSGSPDLPGANATSGVAGILDITIPGYAGTTFQKMGLWRSGYSDGATASADMALVFLACAWRSTSAITSLTVQPVAGSFVTGTTAYLYLS